MFITKCELCPRFLLREENADFEVVTWFMAKRRSKYLMKVCGVPW